MSTDTPTIEIQFLTLAQRRRRDDWAVARVTLHGATGSYGGHTIHDFANKGQLSVQAAMGSILHGETKNQILARFYELGTKDRYAAERELYGIYDVAQCGPVGAGDVRHYLIHRMRDGKSSYQRIAAETVAIALATAEGMDTPGFYAYGIMAADYDEARAAGIRFFEGDGLLI